MVRKSYTPEQIINKLREAEILIGQGATLAIMLKKIGSATVLTTAGARSSAV